MAWQTNGTPDTLESAGDVLTILDLTPLKFNVFLEHEIATGNIDNPTYIFNNNTDLEYTQRQSANGGADTTITSAANILFNIGNAPWDRFAISYVCSIISEEKLIILFHTSNQGSGAGNSPTRLEVFAKFVPSPVADITRIDSTNNGTGSFDTDSNLSALGTD